MSQSFRVLSSTRSFLHSRTCRNLHPRSNPSRNLSSTTKRLAALASLPTKPTVVLATPSPDYIKKEELDVEILPPEQVKLDITDRAADVSPFHLINRSAFLIPLKHIQQLMNIAHREKDVNAALRITVESGGCHGYQYKMKLATRRSPDD